MAAYASLTDLRSRYEGTIATADEALNISRLDEAERLVRSTMRSKGLNLDEVVNAGRTTALDVCDVVCGMVIRILRNPSGATSQAAGPFSVSVDPVTASGKLWLSREDRTKLGLRARSGSIELVDDALPYVVRHVVRHSPWWP
jgi:hypothetical protein